MISLNDVLLAMSNIPVDDPIAEIWGRGLQGGYKIIEYTGSLPITITANGDALLDYRIYGASGGVGVATENLIDANLSEQTIEIKPSTQYNISRYDGNYYSDGLSFDIYDENNDLLWSDYLGRWKGENLSVFDNAKYFKIKIPNRCLNAVSLIEGGRPAGIGREPYPESYIPYGYKLPMTIGDGNTAQSVPVYIGENKLDAIGEYRDYVDFGTQKIIRRIAKIEFDGSENWQTYLNNVYVGVPNYIKSVWGTCAGFSRSSHYAPSLEAQEIGTYCLGGLIQYKSTRWNGNIVINAGMSTTEYRAYLASQVAAGTPVTFWYVVETPVEQDPPVPLSSLPIIKGETVIDYDGDPKPSQMYVKYKGKSGGA